MAVTKESNPGVKNYITPGGFERAETRAAVPRERTASGDAGSGLGGEQR
jgi:hypothetical protein